MVLPLAVTISPESAGSSPTLIRSSVVLPAPLIPVSYTHLTLPTKLEV